MHKGASTLILMEKGERKRPGKGGLNKGNRKNRIKG